MKICLITNLYKPYDVGGAENYVELVAQRLAKQHEIVLITTKPFSGLGSLIPKVETYTGLRIYRFYPLNIYHNFYFRRYPVFIRPIWHVIDIWNIHPFLAIKKILEKEKPSIVHTFNLTGLSASIFASIRKSGCYHVHSILDGGLVSPWVTLTRSGKIVKYNLLDKLYIKLRASITRSANIILSSNQSLLEVHLNHGFFKSSNTCLLPYPVRMNPLNLKPKSYDSINLLYVGVIVEAKGIFVLLDAFKDIGRNDVNLHYVGRGPDLEKLKHKALGLNNIFVHGYMNDEDLGEMYNKANITIVPTLLLSDKPLVVLESLKYGTPVVASRIGGIPEIVNDGVNGKLFEPGSSSELKDIIVDLINHHDKIDQMQRETLKSVDLNDIEKHIECILDVYMGLMSKTSRQPGMGV